MALVFLCRIIIADCFCWLQVGCFHTVGHLILEEIPLHDTADSSSHDVRDVTAVEIEMKAVSKVKRDCNVL